MNTELFKKILSQVANDMIQDANGTHEEAQNFIKNVSNLIDSGSIFTQEKICKINDESDDPVIIATFLTNEDFRKMIPNVDTKVRYFYDNNYIDILSSIHDDLDEILHLFYISNNYEDLEEYYDHNSNDNLTKESIDQLCLNIKAFVEFCEKYNIEYKFDSVEEMIEETGITQVKNRKINKAIKLLLKDGATEKKEIPRSGVRSIIP